MTVVALALGITYEKFLFCHGISDQRRDKKLSFIKYNKRTFYDCFGDSFSVYCGSPTLNTPPMPLYNSSRLNKRACYYFDLLPADIYVATVKSVSILTTYYVSPRVTLLNSYNHNTHHIITREDPGRVRGGEDTDQGYIME